MQTKIEFSPDELEMIHLALRHSAQTLFHASHDLLLGESTRRLRERGEKMTQLASNIRFTGTPNPVSAQDEAGCAGPVAVNQPESTTEKRDR